MAYSYYHSITISSGQMPGTETDFPILISETHADLKTVGNGGYVQNANGYDVAFFSDSALTTQLKHEVERYNAATGETICHVKVPSCAVGTVIYRAFGDSGISASQENITGTWNSAYKGVWHLPDGTTLGVLDSTINDRDGTKVNTPTATTGKVDGAAALASASSQYITTGANILTGTDITVSGWIYTATPATRGFFFDQYDNNLVRGISFEVGLTANKVRGFYAPGVDITSATSLSSDTWYHVALTVTGGSGVLYLNGVSDGTDTGTTTASTTNVEIGRYRGGAGLYWNGRLDEIRASSTARSANWIISEYNNQSSPSTFYSVGVKVGNTTTDQTIVGVYRSQDTLDQTIGGIYSVLKIVDQTVIGVYRSESTEDQTIIGVYRSEATEDATIAGIYNVTGLTTKTIIGIYRSQDTLDQTVLGFYRVHTGINWIDLILRKEKEESITAEDNDYNFELLQLWTDEVKIEVDNLSAEVDLKQPLDQDLTDISALSPNSGDTLVWNGSQWIASVPTSTVGSASAFFLDTTATVGDDLSLLPTPSPNSETADGKSTTSATSPVLFDRFATDELGRTSVAAGLWTFNTYGSTSDDTGSNLIKISVHKRVIKTGLTGTFTGAGATRTFTVSGGTPFVSGDANANILLAGLIETATQTAWITAYTSSTVVTVTLTDPAFVNTSGVSLTAIYYYIFNEVTPELAGASAVLYEITSNRASFSVTATDRLVVSYFSANDTGTHTITLYYAGVTNYSHIQTPVTTLHNDLEGLNQGDYQHLTAAQLVVVQNTSNTNTGDQNLSGYQLTSEKDATGGYVGLSLFKIKFKNAANTFINFLTNATTAARTWTFPDKTGTVAMLDDIPAAVDISGLVPYTGAVSNVDLGLYNLEAQALTVSPADVSDSHLNVDNNSDTRIVALNFKTALAIKGQIVYYGVAYGTVAQRQWLEIQNRTLGGGIEMIVYGGTISAMRILPSGNVGLQITAPTATIHIKAGSTAAETAPIKLTSGALMTAPEVGAIEFLTDKIYFTITTGAARKTIAFLNAAITGATKTKITYDANGFVTAGADATTADIADSSNKRYVTDADLVDIGNLSGTNTGDQTLPVKATGAEVNTGTDDAKFLTPKAIEDSLYIKEAYADAKVADAINNGTTTIAPSQNAVFDALALKLIVASNLSDVANAVTSFNNIKQSASNIYEGSIRLADSTEADAGSSATLGMSPYEVNSLYRRIGWHYTAKWGGSTTTTITTQSVYVLMALGTGTLFDRYPNSDSYWLLGTSRVTYKGSTTKKFKVFFTFALVDLNTVTEGARIVYAIYKNGTIDGHAIHGGRAQYNNTGDQGDCGLMGLFSLATNDYIEFFIRNDSNTNDFQIDYGQVIIEELL